MIKHLLKLGNFLIDRFLVWWDNYFNKRVSRFRRGKMKLLFIGKILVSLGILHLCNGEIKRHKWGKWVPAGNEIDGKKRISIEKRVCCNCKLRQTRKTKEK